jgi:E3 UFM1-protein ligase 1
MPSHSRLPCALHGPWPCRWTCRRCCAWTWRTATNTVYCFALRTLNSKPSALSPQVDLPALLGVDLVHCERQAGAAVAQSGGQLQLVQGELITLAYFDALAVDVADSLRVGSRVLRSEADPFCAMTPTRVKRCVPL